MVQVVRIASVDAGRTFVAGETAEKVRKIIADQIMKDVDDVQLESSPEDLGLDSLRIVDIIFELEEEFDISIPFNFNDPTGSEFRMANVRDVVESVEKLVAE